jgi:biotin transport system substrate-specific component
MEAVLRREIIQDKTACRMVGIAFFVVLMALSAFVRIPLPFTPVPVTLQTLVVLLSGAFLGSRLGAITQASYLALGLAGLPVFTGAASGLVYCAGPTGGYLAGFVIASGVLGLLLKRGTDTLAGIVGKFLVAELVIFSCGVLWLRVLFSASLQQLLLMGVVPFLVGDLVKVGVASVLYWKVQSRLKDIFE